MRYKHETLACSKSADDISSLKAEQRKLPLVPFQANTQLFRSMKSTAASRQPQWVLVDGDSSNNSSPVDASAFPRVLIWSSRHFREQVQQDTVPSPSDFELESTEKCNMLRCVIL